MVEGDAMAVSDLNEVDADQVVEDFISQRGHFLHWILWFMGAWLVVLVWIILKMGLTLTQHIAFGWRVAICGAVIGTIFVPFSRSVWLLRKYVKLVVEEDNYRREQRKSHEVKLRLDALLAKKMLDEEQSELRDELLQLRADLE